MIRYLYPEGKRKAFTLSYDDGVVEDIKFIEIIESYGLSATFHLNSGAFGQRYRVSANEIKDIYKNHEIAMHTVNHPHGHIIPDQELLKQTLEDKRAIEHYSGRIVRGMSYPYGVYSKSVAEIMRAAGVEYSRTIDDTKSVQFNVEDFMFWHPTIHHGNPEAVSLLKSFNNNRYPFILFYLWGHASEFGRNEDKWDTLKELCELAAEKSEEKWFATNIEIYDYYQAVKSLKFSADLDMVYNPSAKDVWIENLKDDDVEIIKISGGETKKLRK